MESNKAAQQPILNDCIDELKDFCRKFKYFFHNESLYNTKESYCGIDYFLNEIYMKGNAVNEEKLIEPTKEELK